ncbi:LOW QUALITY PROTEIN: hypothetical protein Cgig2_004657 [Carnegiea gigantea]|uniref:Uncharacterized protein n=1 Tax=Carnegiea gigantea TaxID=171969 RepID=A0A9Q1JZA3_9CARY|nr:LOW QUALITY PROTEIN: hypothetical protein Cgig2_004657 [Carnegiea gigantea]
MGFPRSLTTDEMMLYVLGNFEWYHGKVVFPPCPLPYDYEELCPDFDLAVAEELGGPQVAPGVFLAMLLNDAVKLGVLRGWMIAVIRPSKNCGGTLSRHGWDVTGAGSWRLVDRRHPVIRKKRRAQSLMTKLPFLVMIARSEAQLAIIIEACIIHRRDGWPCEGNFPRSASCSPHPLPEDFRELCPCFTLSEAEEAARDFKLPEMVQATFYAMLLNNAVELGIVSGFMVTDLRATLEGL